MKEYRNAIRSKRLIREAFAELMEKKQGIDYITVKEIIDTADISKSTFYAHYQDIYAVAEEFESEILDFLEETLDEYINAHTNDIFPYISKIVLELKKNEKLYKKILSPDIPTSFFDKFKEICLNRINKDVKLKGLSSEPNYRYAQIDLIASGFFDLVIDYYHGKVKITLDEIGEIANSVLSHLLVEKK